jgi:hypothetical protein
MNKALTRKEFLRNSAIAAASAAVGAGAIDLFSGKTVKAGTKDSTWPWSYAQLDVEQVRILGHDAYYTKGCCYAGFHALAEKLREAIGDPWTSLPSEIMAYGSGGAAGWGTLCGAPNGAAAVISMVLQTSRSSVLVSELIGWYTQTAFPTDTSNQYAVDHIFTVNNYDQALQQNISGSPLCHESVSQWCFAAGFTASSTERKERCARLAGDVAAYAAQILNDEFNSQFTPLYVAPSTIAGCMACHGTGTTQNVSSKMECTQCHGDPHGSQAVKQIGGNASSYKLETNYPNPFNPSTEIGFSIPQQETVNLSVYDVHGRLVRVVIDQQQYQRGSYKVEWNGLDNNGASVSSGVYFAKFQAGKYTASQKMSLVK